MSEPSGLIAIIYDHDTQSHIRLETNSSILQLFEGGHFIIDKVRSRRSILTPVILTVAKRLFLYFLFVQ